VDCAHFFGIHLHHLGGPTFLKLLQLQYLKPAPGSFIATQALSRYKTWNPVSATDLTLLHLSPFTMRTHQRKRGLDDDSHSERLNDRANLDSHRPQPPPQSLSKRTRTTAQSLEWGVVDDQKEDVRYMMKKPATKQSDSYTRQFIDLTLDDDDDAIHPSSFTSSSKSSQVNLPHRPATGYKPCIEADAMEELDGKIKWRVPKLARFQKETFTRWAQQSRLLRQNEEGDDRKQGSMNGKGKNKKRGSTNKKSKDKKQGPTNEESKGKRQSWIAKSTLAAPGIMFTIPEAIAALKEPPKTVPYDLPAGEHFSYPVTRSYHLGAMRYSVDGTLVKTPVPHHAHIAFRPTCWHDLQPQFPNDYSYGY